MALTARLAVGQDIAGGLRSFHPVHSLTGPDRFFPFFFLGAEKRVWTTTVSCLVLLSTGIWVGVNCVKGSDLLSYPPLWYMRAGLFDTF